jgi:transcriptional regulator with XRE-family HTH domain
MGKLKCHVKTNVLSAAMKQKGVKGVQLAKICGVTPIYISTIVRGKVNPSVLLLKKIADAVNVPMNELVTIEPPKPKSVNMAKDPAEMSEDELIQTYGWDNYVSAYIMHRFAEAEIYKDRATFWVYEQYEALCKKYDAVPPFNKMQFSKIVTRHYGYWIQDVHRKGKKYRVFRMTPPVQDAVQDGFKL